MSDGDGSDRCRRLLPVLAIYSVTMLIGSACTTRRLPPVVARTSDLEVYGHTAEEAQWVLGELESLVPVVRQTLQVERVGPRVAISDTELPGARSAECHDSWIWLGAEALPELHETLAHELVHWFTIGPWETLPGVVEEGLADFLGCELTVTGSTRTAYDLTLYLIALLENPGQWAGLPDFFYLRSGELTEWDDDPRLAGLHGLGYLLVSRIGIDRLRAVCVEAQRRGLRLVPADEVFRAAGLQPWDLIELRMAAYELLEHPIHPMRIEGLVPPGATTFEIK